MALPTWSPDQTTILNGKQVWTLGSSSSDLQQLIDYVNLKISETGLGTTIGAFSQNAPVTASSLANIKTQIDAIRSGIGMSAYSWTSTYTPTSDVPWFARFIYECRDAMDLQFTIYSVATKNVSCTWPSGNVYPDVTGATYASSSGGIGKRQTRIRDRAGFTFTLPTIYGSVVTATLNYAETTVSESGEALVVEAYASSTDDSAYPIPTAWESGWTTKSGKTYCGGDAHGTNGYVGIPNSVLAGRSGSNLSILIGTQNELAGTGIGNTTSFFGSSMSPWLTIDYR